MNLKSQACKMILNIMQRGELSTSLGEICPQCGHSVWPLGHPISAQWYNVSALCDRLSIERVPPRLFSERPMPQRRGSRESDRRHCLPELNCFVLKQLIYKRMFLNELYNHLQSHLQTKK